ncbi:MAG TPA: hypothetical protein VFQ53_12005 [Kofleriaceae bacterium]|nr:hypothetical protein [Kofleriaceae bacterium]
MSARFLDDEARAAFGRAIEAVEAASSIEVVVAVRRRSAAYLHANILVGTLIAFAALGAMLFASHEFSLTSIWFDPFAVGLASGGLVELLPGVKRVLTTAARRRAHVERAARATFVERGVHNTLDRSGLLVYISWLEQQVVLVPDSGLARAVSADVLAKTESALAAAMPAGGAAVAKLLGELADRVGVAMPRRTDDLNELPDAIDSDLARAERRRRPR